jgi:hypothetical protein
MASCHVQGRSYREFAHWPLTKARVEQPECARDDGNLVLYTYSRLVRAAGSKLTSNGSLTLSACPARTSVSLTYPP